jgi:hypothetical protein
MPEDLPATKPIDVMVGITRSIVLFVLALQHVVPGVNMSGPFIALRRFVGTAGVPKSLKSWETAVLY